MRYVSLRYNETKAILVLFFDAFSELGILRPDTKTMEVSNRPMSQFQNALEMRYVSLR
jgi:hypothetical protein